MELNKELNKTATESKSKLTATIKENNKPAFWFLMPSLLILTLFTFYPMIMTVYNSFFATNIRGEAAKFVGLGNYFSIFQDTLFLKSLAGTLVYVVAFAAITIVGLKSIFETDFKRHSEPRLPSTAQINH